MPSTTNVELGPLIQYAAPIALALVSTAITWGIKVAASAIQKLTHHTITQGQQDQIRDWCNDQAGKAILASKTNLAGESIHISDPVVQNGVKLAQVVIPDLLAATGVTPEKVADMIAGEIGRLQPQQAQSTSAVAVIEQVPPPVAGKLIN